MMMKYQQRDGAHLNDGHHDDYECKHDISIMMVMVSGVNDVLTR